MNQPNLHLTSAELDRSRQILENYAPAREALTVLENNNGEFATSFDRLWTEKMKPYPTEKNKNLFGKSPLKYYDKKSAAMKAFDRRSSITIKTPEARPY